MLGLLLWSIHQMQQQNDLSSCIIFAILLNMKHLFVYAAPVFLVYTLGHYCKGKNAFKRFLIVGSAVVAVFSASFGPFIALGQIQQVMWVLHAMPRVMASVGWQQPSMELISCEYWLQQIVCDY